MKLAGFDWYSSPCGRCRADRADGARCANRRANTRRVPSRARFFRAAWTCRSENAYFVNLCQRGSTNASCFDANGNPLGTFACQTVKGWGYSVDIGTTIGFNPPINNLTAEQGLLVTLENGTPCAGTKGPRTSYISMVCDTSAGIGRMPGSRRARLRSTRTQRSVADNLDCRLGPWARASACRRVPNVGRKQDRGNSKGELPLLLYLAHPIRMP